MKEVKEWNGKPRWMWVWDYEENKKVKDYVLCILTEEEMKESGAVYPVRAIENNYEHCTEIEEETMKETRLTNYELAQLLKCFGVEFYDYGSYSYNDKLYKIGEENVEVPEDHKIRYKQGEWEEPTRETVLKWWSRDGSYGDIARFVAFIGWEINKE